MTSSPLHTAPLQHHQSLFPAQCYLGILLVALLSTICDACSEPPRHETMDLVGSPRPHYNVGERVLYVCKPGYQQRASSTIFTTCAANGVWTPLSKDSCTTLFKYKSRKPCPTQSDPVNGQVKLLNGSFEVGSQIQFVCNEGFYLIGRSILKCLRSGSNVYWSSDPPLCEKILCEPPPKIKNGTYSSSDKEVFEYHEIVTYSCDQTSGPDQFSLVGEKQIYCSGNRAWSSEPPQCKVVKCPFPVVENGQQTSGFQKKYAYKAKVMFKCNQGFALHGKDMIVCDADNTWKPPVPKCLKEPPRPPTSSTKPPNSSKPTTSGVSGALDFQDLNGWIFALTVAVFCNLLELQ